MSPPREPSGGPLVIVPCGKAKIWDKLPGAGPTAAADAYIVPPFIVNRTYAKQAGGDWGVLSAKYGFLRPGDLVPGPYNVTFKRKSTNPISISALREQAEEMRLDRYDEVLGLGGKEYRDAIGAVFNGAHLQVTFPFAGLPIGPAMRAIKQATVR